MWRSVVPFLFFAGAAPADMPPVSESFGDLSLWGLYTQGYVWADRYSFFGSGAGGFGYREGSLGAQYRLLPEFSVNAQGEYRDAGQSDNLGFRLGQAYMDARHSFGEDTVVGVNLGRIELPFGLYNATRDRIDTRPSIVLPESVYFDGLGLRDYILTGDGGLVYGAYDLGPESKLEAKVAMGRSAFGKIPGLEGAVLFSGWLDYVPNGDLLFRLSMLRSEKAATSITYPVLSAQYTWNRWTLTSEWGRLEFDSPQGSVSSNGVYGQVEYQATKDFSLFARYDYLKFHLEAPLEVPRGRLRGQSLAVGFAWNLSKNSLVNVGYHLVDGTAFLNAAENPSLGSARSAERDWNLLAMTASVRF